MVGGFLSILWCFAAMLLSLYVQTQNSSLFPEVDIASKATDTPTSQYPILSPSSTYNSYTGSYPLVQNANSFSRLVSPLNNAGSVEIRKKLANARFYVRWADTGGSGFGGRGRVVLRARENGMRLARQTKWPEKPGMI
jgi:hypothetical protein